MRELTAWLCALAIASAVPSVAYADTLNLTVQVLSSSTTSTPPVLPPPGGGGGGGSSASSETGVTLSGRAYPLSRIIVLKDGVQAISTIAGPDAAFSVSLTRISSGMHTISLYSEDGQGRRSVLFSFPLTVTAGARTVVSGIFISPTIELDKTTVRRGDPIAVFGQTVPDGEVTIAVHSAFETIKKVRSDEDGVYVYYVDTTPLEQGGHEAQSFAEIDSQISPQSAKLAFTVGTENVFKTAAPTTCQRADINCDGRVDLVDYSILAYWYQRPGSLPERVDLNGDATVSLVDFSILAYYWTG